MEEIEKVSEFEKYVNQGLENAFLEIEAEDISRVRDVLYRIQQHFDNTEVQKRLLKVVEDYVDEKYRFWKLGLFVVGIDVEEIRNSLSEFLRAFLSFCGKRPYLINLYSILIIELLYLKQNKNEVVKAKIIGLFGQLDRNHDTAEEKKEEHRKDIAKYIEYLQADIEITSSDPFYYNAFAFTLRQTPILYISEFLEYYKEKHEEDNYFTFLRSVLNENGVLFSKAQIEIIEEWIAENTSITRKRKIPQIDDTRLIKIKAEKIEPLHKRLSEYFPKQKDLLKSALEGKEIDTKLHFQGKSNTLIYVFTQLHNKQLTNNTQSQLIDYIHELFVFGEDQADLKSASKNNIKNVLTKKDRIPREKIDLSDL